MRAHRFRSGLRLAAALLALLAPPRPAAAADALTEWTLLADSYGRGIANWRTLAIMHQAMHDALNAALPTYARWAPPAAGEPPREGEHAFPVGRPEPAVDHQRRVPPEDDADVRHEPDAVVADHPHAVGHLVEVGRVDRGRARVGDLRRRANA